MLTPEQLLEAAEKVRAAAEEREAEALLERMLRVYYVARPPTWVPGPQLSMRMPYCGCAIGTVCGNTSCPHRIVITC